MASQTFYLEYHTDMTARHATPNSLNGWVGFTTGVVITKPEYDALPKHWQQSYKKLNRLGIRNVVGYLGNPVWCHVNGVGLEQAKITHAILFNYLYVENPL